METNPHVMSMVLFDHWVDNVLVTIVWDVRKVASSLSAVWLGGRPRVINRYDLVAGAVDNEKGPMVACSMLKMLLWADVASWKCKCLLAISSLKKWIATSLYLHVMLCIGNWWMKGKALRKHSLQQPRFYWSCSSVVMNDATPLTPPSAWAELQFQM